MEKMITLEDFMHVVRCSKAAYLNKYHPTVADDKKRSLIPEVEREVQEVLCNLIQPNGVKMSKIQDTEEKIRKTRQIIVDKPKYTVHDAVFLTSDQELAVVTALQKEKDISAWLVKADTEKVYLEDIWPAAYQYHVLHKCGIKVNKFFIASLNPNYKQSFEGPQKLFVFNDVTLECRRMQREVEKYLIRLRKIYKQKEEPEVSIGYQCPTPQCIFYKYCWSSLDEGSVFEFFDMTFPQKFRLYQKGYEKISDVPATSRLTSAEKIQLECHKSKKPYLNKNGLSKLLKEFQSEKLTFLDLNVLKAPIPTFQGSSPLTILPYHFSTLKLNNGKAQEESFTINAQGKYDFRYEFIKSLLRGLEPNEFYPIIVWQASYVKAHLNVFKRWYSALANEIDSISKRIFSLQSPFKERQYYHHLFGGRDDFWAISRAMISEDMYLDLEISNNRDAQRAFYSIKNGSVKELQRARDALEHYSRFKVNALHMILSRLRAIS